MTRLVRSLGCGCLNRKIFDRLVLLAEAAPARPPSVQTYPCGFASTPKEIRQARDLEKAHGKLPRGLKGRTHDWRFPAGAVKTGATSVRRLKPAASRARDASASSPRSLTISNALALRAKTGS